MNCKKCGHELSSKSKFCSKCGKAIAHKVKRSNCIDKINHNLLFKVISISGFLIVLFLTFYWFQLRPAHIRQECSWVKRSSDFVPAVTQEQADKLNEECIKQHEEDYNNYIQSGDKASLKNYVARKYREDGYESICNTQPSLEKPEKEWYEPANQSEYQFCLHSRGL